MVVEMMASQQHQIHFRYEFGCQGWSHHVQEGLEVHKASEENVTADLQPIFDRSIFLTVPMQQCAGVFEGLGYVVIERAKDKYEDKHLRVLAFQIMEDGVHRQRRMEDAGNTYRYMQGSLAGIY